MAYLIAVLLVFGVVLIVASPWRQPRQAAAAADGEPSGAQAAAASEGPSPERLELEAARDAKFREIRDAELDHQTGKLSDDDFDAIDSTLRAEAMELLHKLDALAD